MAILRFIIDIIYMVVTLATKIHQQVVYRVFFWVHLVISNREISLFQIVHSILFNTKLIPTKFFFHWCKYCID